MPNIMIDRLLVDMLPIFIIMTPVIIGVILLLKWNKDKTKIKPFKEKPLKATFYDELKKKTSQFGGDTKGFKLVRDFQIVGFPEKYMKIDIEMPKYTLDEKSKEVKTTEETVKTKLIILKSYHKNLILRTIGKMFDVFKTYFILEITGDYEDILKIEPEKKKMNIQGQIDFMTFGNVWIMSESGHEYLSNISIKRALEQSVMHSENMVDRVVHYDKEQAKLERRDRIATDLEKSKYDERKQAGDSTIL